MTDERIERRAVDALSSVRAGEVILPPEALGAALDVVEEIAKRLGLDVDAVIASYDPDPRLGSVAGYGSIGEMLADLDERERYLAVRVAHRYHIACAAALDADPDLEPSLLAAAHDNAIAEAREAAAKNGAKR